MPPPPVPVELGCAVDFRFRLFIVKNSQALILAPTYELALQIGEVLQKMASRTEIVVEQAIRGKRCEY